MKKLLFVLALFINVQLFAQKDVLVQDPAAVERPLSASFNSVSVATGIELTITQGNEEKLAISVSDPKYLDRFVTKVENGELKIYYDYNGVKWLFDKTKKLKAYLSVKSISRLKASSGAKVKVINELTASEFSIDLSSGARMDGTVKAVSLDVEVSSGAMVSLNGSSSSADVKVSSGANFEGFDFSADNCTAKASSGASVEITINRQLKGKANSGGSIRYKGAVTQIDSESNSGGSVKKA
ncbi:MAG: head GIN domain-containing protein [Ferruginibacter sp.]